jgi:uncharacterized protein (TIGR02646 family)
MRPIVHPTNPPQVLQRAIDRGATNWNRFDGHTAVTEVLLQEQKYLCAYCQIRLDSPIGSHIEHIWPKHAHVDMTFQWSNLVLSCTHSSKIGAMQASGGVSCGHSKSSAYDARFVSPTTNDCDRFFEYHAADGTVQPAPGLTAAETDRASYTIQLLNLNCRRLCRLRKDMLKEGYRIIRELMDEDTDALRNFLACELEETNNRLPMFISARQQHFGVFA